LGWSCLCMLRLARSQYSQADSLGGCHDASVSYVLSSSPMLWVYFDKGGHTGTCLTVNIQPNLLMGPDYEHPLTHRSTYPCFILYIVSIQDQTNDLHLSGLST